jgi:hypothetical protein
MSTPTSKAIAISACLALISLTLSAQTVYYDTEKLAKGFENGIFSKSDAKIIGEYFSIPPALAEGEYIRLVNDSLRKSKNPFLNKYQLALGALGAIETGRKSISSVGGLNVTSFADGLAQFLVARFKDELSITFFTRFKEELNDPKYADLKILFPQTISVLSVIDEDIYRFNAYLNTLREVFIKDLTNSFTNLQTLVRQPKYDTYFRANHKELGTILYSSLYIINALANGQHAGKVIEGFDVSKNILVNDENLIASVRTIQLFSGSFKSRSSDTYWVPADSASAVLKNPNGAKIYFGLIYQLALRQKIKFADKSLTDILKKIAEAAEKFEAYRIFAEAVADQTTEIELYYQAVKGKPKNEIDYNDYYKLYTSTVALVNLAAGFMDLPDVDVKNETEVKNNIARITATASSMGELYIDVRTANYASGIVNLVSIIDTLAMAKAPNAKIDTRMILTYGTFMANVAQAKSSDEVKGAIEAIALPAGSARIKRKTKSNIALNAYIGLAGGTEYYGTTAQWKGIFGMTAPVGVAFSWGHACCTNPDKSAGSSSFFISLIDVGALSTFRINDDETEALPEVTLANIFAPGLYYVYGIANTPLSIGLGAQLGPQLRKITATDATLHDDLNVSFRVFVAVDIPLINFRTKPR